MATLSHSIIKSEMTSANKVIANTSILYARMALTVGISLYSTRLILHSLGSIDFGIFSLLISVIALMSFLNTAMSLSTQRFFSFYQGEGDLNKQMQVFANSLLLHLIIGVFAVVSLEFFGVSIMNSLLTIPSDRIDATNTVYHYLMVNIFFSVISVPFIALLTAHEEMLWVAVVNIIEVILKLGIAIFLLDATGDKLVIYGILITVISAISFFIYVFYCFRRYSECTLNPKYLNKPLMKSLASFVGWNSFGVFCLQARNQGLAIVLNLFFGPIANTAYGISNQVGSQLLFFSSNMLRTINPQIVKSEGAGNRERMVRISLMASKYGFLIFALFAIPFLYETQGIIFFWLKKVPENAVLFCQFMIIASLFKQLTLGLPLAIHATGKIKEYQLLIGILWILNLPIAYFLLKFGFGISSVMLSYVIIEALCNIGRICIAKKIFNLNIKMYFNKVILKVIIPTVSYCFFCFLMVTYTDFSGRFFVTSLVCGSFFITITYLIGTENDEKFLIKNAIDSVKQKFPKKITR